MSNSEIGLKKLDIQDLSDWFRSGIKSEKKWGIGTEHEQFLYNSKHLTRLGFDTQPGIRIVLEEMQAEGWEPVLEEGHLIALSRNGATITLEPGGQFELSGANLNTVHETYAETKEHLESLSELGKELGFYNLPIGFDPFWKREDIPWMPKERYRYMKAWMPKKGNLGLDMMTRTSSIQVNLDFSSEEDMVKKAQVAQAFQPVIMALFANSPFTENQPNGYISYRSQVWEDTDNDRCGFLPFVFDEDFGFDRWTEYLLDIPMYFIFRNEEYHSSNGMTFREYMDKGQPFEATIEDWEVHVSTVFPDIRLKKYLELRGADAGDLGQITALAAFWVGLFYDQQALDKVHEMSKEMGVDMICGLRAQVPKNGLGAEYKSVILLDIARKLVETSYEGLGRRAEKLGIESEQKYLKPLQEIVTSGKTVAERYLDKFHNEWDGDLKQIFSSQQ